MNTVLHLFLAAPLLVILASAAPGPQSVCEVCGGPFIWNTRYTRMDQWTGEQRSYCDNCRRLETVCAICQIPVKSPITDLGDGRHLCQRDAKLVILDDAEATQVLAEPRLELDRLLARFTTVPSTNIDFAFENQLRMQQILQSPGFERQCPFLLGTTRSLLFHNRGWQHEIRVLRALPRSEMIAVYLHELGHAWLRENVPPSRRLAQTAVEGFCELLAYLVLEPLGETTQLDRIRRNGYSQGQIDLFIQAHQIYNLHFILQWMKFGEDPYLREADLDRIRLVDLPRNPAPAPRPLLRLAHPPTGAPEVLTLMGLVSGTGSNRAAMINGKLMSMGDTSAVPLGTNCVTILCTEIGTNYVVLKVVKSGETVRLEWPTEPP